MPSSPSPPSIQRAERIGPRCLDVDDDEQRTFDALREEDRGEWVHMAGKCALASFLSREPELIEGDPHCGRPVAQVRTSYWLSSTSLRSSKLIRAKSVCLILGCVAFLILFVKPAQAQHGDWLLVRPQGSSLCDAAWLRPLPSGAVCSRSECIRWKRPVCLQRHQNSVGKVVFKLVLTACLMLCPPERRFTHGRIRSSLNRLVRSGEPLNCELAKAR